MAKLQVAIDLLSTKEALDLAAKVAPYVDIIELGTPLIKSEGLAVIKAMKAAHPNKLVFADFKTADTGELEAGMAFGAGADLVTILGSVDDATVIGAVKAAKEHGKGVVVDTIGVKDRVKRAQEVSKLGVEFVELHAGLDEQAAPRLLHPGPHRRSQARRRARVYRGRRQPENHRGREGGRRGRGRSRWCHLRRRRPRRRRQSLARSTGRRLGLSAPAHKYCRAPAGCRGSFCVGSLPKAR